MGVCNSVIGNDGRWGTDTGGNATYRPSSSNDAFTWSTSGSTGTMMQNDSNIRTDLARVADGETGMYAFDYATGKVWTGKGGSWDNSGNPATGANPSGTWSTAFEANTLNWFFFSNENNAVVVANFGSPVYSISSGNQDDNDRGNFEYDVPESFLSLCTLNLKDFL